MYNETWEGRGGRTGPRSHGLQKELGQVRKEGGGGGGQEQIIDSSIGTVTRTWYREGVATGELSRSFQVFQSHWTSSLADKEVGGKLNDYLDRTNYRIRSLGVYISHSGLS